jgi:hypothetical protein
MNSNQGIKSDGKKPPRLMPAVIGFRIGEKNEHRNMDSIHGYSLGFNDYPGAKSASDVI